MRQKLCHSNGVSKFCKQKKSIKFRKVLFIARTRGMELAFCGWRIWSWGFTFKWKVLCSNLRLISTFHWLNIRSTSLVCRYRNLKQMLKSCGNTFKVKPKNIFSFLWNTLYHWMGKLHQSFSIVIGGSEHRDLLSRDWARPK